MDDNFDNLSKDELKDIIKDLQNENKKLKTDLHIMKILKDNYESGKKNEDNYREEIFNIVKDDIYIQKLVGPKPTSFDKNAIKFCITELYNTCKYLEPFMINNNIKCRTDLAKFFQNNNNLYEKYNIKNYIELENIIKKYKNIDMNNYNNVLEDNINIISESIKNIVIDNKKENKIQCTYIPSKGKNKNIQCNKNVNNETKGSNSPLCSIHKKIINKVLR